MGLPKVSIFRAVCCRGYTRMSAGVFPRIGRKDRCRTMYFDNVDDIKELKRKYKDLAFSLHPDMGGDAHDFIKMNDEYESVYQAIKSGKSKRDDAVVDDGYREVLEVLMKIPVSVELCGEWLWISGNTKEYKDKLKEVGCKWACKKQMWYWKPAWMKKRYKKKEWSMGEIRDKYGSKSVMEVQGLTA